MTNQTSLVFISVGVSGVGLEVEIVDEEGHCQQSCLHLNTFVDIVRIVIVRIDIVRIDIVRSAVVRISIVKIFQNAERMVTDIRGEVNTEPICSGEHL